MGGGTFFKVGGTSARQKFRKFLWVELATVTSQSLKYDVINFVSMFEQFYAIRPLSALH